MKDGIFRGALLVGLLATAQAALPAEQPDYFAKIGDSVITVGEYAETLQQAMRKRFYHGSPPEAEVAAFRREIGDMMIDRVLLVEEAKRRGIEVDESAIGERLARDEQRYQGHPQWPEQRERALAFLGERYRNESLIARLEADVREVPLPAEKDLKRYYGENKDKFTEPERIKVSIIMLTVAPSAPQEVWDEATEKAKELVEELRGGGDFAELATLHSADVSAKYGGDAGYLHRGMLGASAQEAIDAMQPGQISDPIMFLEGVAILRLDERREAKLNPLAAVRDRAVALWQRDEGERRWEALKKTLRKDTAVTVNEQLYTPEVSRPQGAMPSQ